LSIASVSTSGTAFFSTSTTSYAIDASLVYMPFIDESTVQLLTGATQDGPSWTIELRTLIYALNHADTEVSERDITITATGQSVVIMLPFNGEFAFIQLDALQIRDFVVTSTSTPFATWGDGRTFAGMIDEGEMPCFA